MALRIVRKSVGLRPRTFGGGRSAEISSNSASISNDVILCPIGLVPRHRESPQVVANQGESDPARPVNQFQVRLSDLTIQGNIRVCAASMAKATQLLGPRGQGDSSPLISS